jgi:septum formation protein
MSIAKCNQAHYPDPAEYVQATATEKAKDVYKRKRLEDPFTKKKHVVIGCDTIVVMDDVILEKPKDKEHARSMLRSLSGKGHWVFTALCVLWTHEDQLLIKTQVEKTQVQFSDLSEDLIEAYVASGEPMYTN